MSNLGDSLRKLHQEEQAEKKSQELKQKQLDLQRQSENKVLADSIYNEFLNLEKEFRRLVYPALLELAKHIVETGQLGEKYSKQEISKINRSPFAFLEKVEYSYSIMISYIVYKGGGVERNALSTNKITRDAINSLVEEKSWVYKLYLENKHKLPPPEFSITANLEWGYHTNYPGENGQRMSITLSNTLIVTLSNYSGSKVNNSTGDLGKKNATEILDNLILDFIKSGKTQWSYTNDNSP